LKWLGLWCLGEPPKINIAPTYTFDLHDGKAVQKDCQIKCKCPALSATRGETIRSPFLWSSPAFSLGKQKESGKCRCGRPALPLERLNQNISSQGPRSASCSGPSIRFVWKETHDHSSYGKTSKDPTASPWKSVERGKNHAWCSSSLQDYVVEMQRQKCRGGEICIRKLQSNRDSAQYMVAIGVRL
jgi:hypothetical protein